MSCYPCCCRKVRGTVATMYRGLAHIQGVGGSLSNVAGGTLVKFAGYGMALGVLAFAPPVRPWRYPHMKTATA